MTHGQSRATIAPTMTGITYIEASTPFGPKTIKSR